MSLAPPPRVLKPEPPDRPARLFLGALAVALATSGCQPSGAHTTRSSFLLTTQDGTRVAVTVWVPDHPAGQTIPAMLRLTRYWREHAVSPVLPVLLPYDDVQGGRPFVDEGYAWISVDARGTGASFGSSRGPWAREEIADYGEVIDWIVKQPWSNGRVGAIGVSYEGTAALRLTVLHHPALKAVVPQYFFYDPATSVLRPGGVLCKDFVKGWSDTVAGLDRNDFYSLCRGADVSVTQCTQSASLILGVSPVDGASGQSLLRAAVAEHAANVNIYEAGRATTYADDPLGTMPTDDAAPISVAAALATSQAPMMTRVSWMDSSTVRGALQAFDALPNVPQQLIIGTWSHGGFYDADPYRADDAPPEPPWADQQARALAFLDTHLKTDTPLARSIRYSTLGEAGFRETTVWPPAGGHDTTLAFDQGGALTDGVLTPSVGTDRYAVDFTATSGALSRWRTPLGGPDVAYGDRQDADARELVYTGAALTSDLRIVGTPRIELAMSSTHGDGAVYVYLEDVHPDGRVTYLTEGVRRLMFPTDSTLRADARPVTPGSKLKLSISLEPVSAIVRARHRLRVAIAGHDQDNFERLPSEGEPVLSIYRGPGESTLTLPVGI